MGLLDKILGRPKQPDDDGQSRSAGDVLEPSPDQLGGADSASARPGVAAGEGGSPEATPGA